MTDEDKEIYGGILNNLWNLTNSLVPKKLTTPAETWPVRKLSRPLNEAEQEELDREPAEEEWKDAADYEEERGEI